VRILTFVLAGSLLGVACTPAQSAAAPEPRSPEPSPTATAAATPSQPAPTVVPSIAPTAPPLTAPPLTARPSTPAPATAQPTSGARAYRTLPVGATLPSEAQCANEIVRDTWEPRPDNRAANQTNAWTNGFRLQGSYLATIASGYQERVTGNFTGTTDQILRWAACKWGFDEDDVRAQAVTESYWRQSLLSDCGVTAQPQANGCASMGIMSVKGADIPATHPGTWPAAYQSTAFNVDYALAVRRLCFDGKETWQKQFNSTYGAGDVWGCIGRWFSGRWHDASADTYITRVRSTMTARTWLSSGF